MKKIATLLLCICMLVTVCLLAASCGSGDEPPEGMQNVAIETESFKFYVPESWLSQANSGVSGARYGNNDDKSNVTVTRFVPSYMDEGKPANYWLTLEKDYRAQFSTFEMDESCVSVAEDGTVTTVGKDVTFGGRSAKQYVYTMTFGGTVYKQMQVLCQHSDGDLYIFTYTSSPACYAAHLEEVAEMLIDFRFG